MPNTETLIAALLADIDSGQPQLTASHVRRLRAVTHDGRARDLSWVHRQRQHGTRTKTGERLKLPFVIGAGGAYVTTEATVMRWIRALNGIAPGQSDRQQLDAHARAQKQLQAAGL